MLHLNIPCRPHACTVNIRMDVSYDYVAMVCACALAIYYVMYRVSAIQFEGVLSKGKPRCCINFTTGISKLELSIVSANIFSHVVLQAFSHTGEKWVYQS